MVSVGLHALVLRKHKGCELTEQPAAWEDQMNNQGMNYMANCNVIHFILCHNSSYRKQIDPETAKYFAEIANAIEADRSGSHVVETALKSVSFHLQDNENHSLIEKALKKICKAIVVNPVDIMCSCHGSHVLRSLLCLFNGVPLEEFHSTKSSAGLAERLNLKAPHAKDNGSMQSLKIFPSLLKKFISEMLNAASEDILKLQVNQYSSLVLQTALKLLVGSEQELLHLIQVLLGSWSGSATAGSLLEETTMQNILRLVEETAYSHLMEAILEFSPETLYNELLTKVFRKSLFLMSSSLCKLRRAGFSISCQKSGSCKDFQTSIFGILLSCKMSPRTIRIEFNDLENFI
ncbi:putative pumilio -like protein 23-like isoform 2 [Capsicum annuum]|nr:putative pumilio -like protein 23-like isoform 2 [Capsicum annuum]KAF3679195.1 putative pumilio -like protein 23-like isoform 2 [Capsicum annuum]